MKQRLVYTLVSAVLLSGIAFSSDALAWGGEGHGDNGQPQSCGCSGEQYVTKNYAEHHYNKFLRWESEWLKSSFYNERFRFKFEGRTPKLRFELRKLNYEFWCDYKSYDKDVDHHHVYGPEFPGHHHDWRHLEGFQYRGKAFLEFIIKYDLKAIAMDEYLVKYGCNAQVRECAEKELAFLKEELKLTEQALSYCHSTSS